MARISGISTGGGGDGSLPSGSDGAILAYQDGAWIGTSAANLKASSGEFTDGVSAASITSDSVTVSDEEGAAQLLSDSLTMSDVEITKNHLAGIQAATGMDADHPPIIEGDTRLTDARHPMAHGGNQHVGIVSTADQVSIDPDDYEGLLAGITGESPVLNDAIKILDAHSHAYSAITDKPSTFAPSSHGSSAHSGTIGTESQITFSTSEGHNHDGSNSRSVASSVPEDCIRSHNDGRVVLTTAGSGASIMWNGYAVGLYDPTAGQWILVKPSSPPTATNIATDLDSAALAGNSVYDVYLEYSSVTAANLVFKKWTNLTTRAVTPALWEGILCYDNSTDNGKKRRYIGIISPYISGLTIGAWSNTTTYVVGDKVTSGGHYYVSLKDSNLNNAVDQTSWWQDQGVSDDGRGVFADQRNRRLIFNACTRQSVSLGVTNPYTGTTSESLNAQTHQVWQKDGSGNSIWQVDFLTDGNIPIFMEACYFIVGSPNRSIGIGVDSKTALSSKSGASSTFVYNLMTGTSLVDTPALGRHYVVPLHASSNTVTCYYWDHSAYDYYDRRAYFHGLMGGN